MAGFPQRQLQSALKRKGQRYVSDKNRLLGLIWAAADKTSREKQRIHHFLRDLGALLRLLKAWATGSYKEVPWKTILLAMAAVIYFVDPLDFIADFVPAVGYLDDAAVVAWVLSSVGKDMERFLLWEKSMQAAPAQH